MEKFLSEWDKYLNIKIEMLEDYAFLKSLDSTTSKDWKNFFCEYDVKIEESFSWDSPFFKKLKKLRNKLREKVKKEGYDI